MRGKKGEKVCLQTGALTPKRQIKTWREHRGYNELRRRFG